jgi:hypothetical protein
MIETIELNEILVLLFIAVALSIGSFYFGWLSHRRHVLKMFDSAIDELMIDVSIEHHDGQYYLYYLDKKEFICQATTIEKLAFKFNETLGSEYVGRVVTPEYECLIVDGKIET